MPETIINAPGNEIVVSKDHAAPVTSTDLYEPSDFPSDVITRYTSYSQTLGPDVAEEFLKHEATRLGVKPVSAAPAAVAATPPAVAANATPANEPHAEPGEPANDEGAFIKSLKNKGKNTPPATPKEYKDITEIQATVEKTFGVKQLPEFIESAGKWKADSQAKGDLERQLDEMNKGIGQLPAPLRAAIAAEIEAPGSNAYLNILADPRMSVDFNKSFESNDFNTLVKLYYPEAKDKDFTKADDPEIKKIKEIIVKQFTVDQKSYANEVRTAAKNREEGIKTLSGSLDSSLSALKKDIPGITQSQLDGVRATMRSRDQLASLGIFGKDNNYTANAAKVIWYAKNAEQRIKELTDLVGELQGSTEAVLSRSSDVVHQPGRVDVLPDKDKKGPQEQLFNRMLPDTQPGQQRTGGIKFTITPAKT